MVFANFWRNMTHGLILVKVLLVLSAAVRYSPGNGTVNFNQHSAARDESRH